MNPNSFIDNFIFNFPSNFVPKEIEDRWKIILKNYRKPFPTVLDYVNSNIKDISLPAMQIPDVKQTKIYGKERNFRSGVSPYDISSREFNITMKNSDFNLFYFLLKDILYYHFIKNNQPFIGDFTISVIDFERREFMKIYLKEILFLGLSDIRFANNEKDVKEQEIELSFKYNYEDIEFMAEYSEIPTTGDLLDSYSNIILAHDTSVPTSPPNTTNDEDENMIIGE